MLSEIKYFGNNEKILLITDFKKFGSNLWYILYGIWYPWYLI